MADQAYAFIREKKKNVENVEAVLSVNIISKNQGAKNVVAQLSVNMVNE